MRALPFSMMLLALAGVAACSSGPGNAPVKVPEVALQTVTLEPANLPATRDWDGRVEAVDRATLAAQTGGRVADLAVDVGDMVEEGQVLVRFTDVEQQSGQRQAQAALAAARAAAEEAAAEFLRVKDIYARHLVSRSDFDRATATNDSAQAQLAAARAALRSADQQVGYTAIRAPYRGVVTARHVEPGETVSPGQALLSGVSLDRLRVVVDVPQSVAARLRPETPAFVETADGQRIAVARLTVFPQADAASHAVSVRLDLPEGVTVGLMPGASAKGVFELDQAPVLSVPASALAVRGEVESVHVLGQDGLVTLRQVRTGRRLGDQVEILAGLAPGEQVAVDAAAALAARRAQREKMMER